MAHSRKARVTLFSTVEVDVSEPDLSPRLLGVKESEMWREAAIMEAIQAPVAQTITDARVEWLDG